jgi:hypothetical protein
MWGEPQEGISREEWEGLRPVVWSKWLELIALPPVPYVEPPIRRAAFDRGEPDPGRKQPRDSESTWPPAAAAYDGIRGKVLSTRWNPPERYVGGWDARPEIAKLAEEGLAEVAGFRRERPEAAESIADALEVYGELLEHARDEPESRLLP